MTKQIGKKYYFLKVTKSWQYVALNFPQCHGYCSFCNILLFFQFYAFAIIFLLTTLKLLFSLIIKFFQRYTEKKKKKRNYSEYLAISCQIYKRSFKKSFIEHTKLQAKSLHWTFINYFLYIYSWSIPLRWV